jgi:malonyl-CoA decarboxylase
MKNLYSVAALALNFTKAQTAALGDDELRRIDETMRQCIARRGGDVATGARAATLIERYLTLDAPGRLRFVDLAASFGTDRLAVDAALAAVADAHDEAERAAAERSLRVALSPARG